MTDSQFRQGRVQIPLARGIFTNRRTDGNKRKPVMELLAKHNTAVYQISKFKYDPSFAPEMGNIYARKISAACSLCLPDTILQLDEEVKSLGIHNCFNVETGNLDRSFVSRCFPYLFHFWTKGKTSTEGRSYVNPREIVEDSDLLDAVTALNQGAQSQEDIDKWNKIIEEVLTDMCSTKCWAAVLVVRLTGWLLGKALKRMFECICVHKGEIELLQRANATDLPIIYIPVSHSYMDPIIIHWTLLNFGLPTPYFFTSGNFRYLTKYFGGIGPSQNRDKNDHRRVYGSVLRSYIRQLLKKSSSIQLSLEAHRSRSGKPSTELYGTEFLQIVYDSFKTLDIEDVYIVPVNVSYEILPDNFDGITFEDKSLQKTSILSFIKSIWQSMNKPLGGVRVDFGQPFSFREFYPSMKTNKKINTVIESYNDTAELESYSKTFEATELCWKAEHGSTASIPSLYEDMHPNPEGILVQIFLDTLANHSIYSAKNFSTPMCTHLVAFLLLKKFRYGTTLETLVKEAVELMKILKRRGRDFGFTGDVASAVVRAIELFGPQTITISNEKSKEVEKEVFVIKPVLDGLSLNRLGYYSNMILPAFAMEAIVAVAVFALVGNQLSVARGFEIDVRVKDEAVMMHTRRIYELFSGAFFLHSPCLTAEIAIRKTLDIMNDGSLLQSLMDEAVKRARCFDSDEELESEDEGAVKASNAVGGEFFNIPYEYKVVTSEENYETLSFLRNLLVPYLEIYAVIGNELECLLTLDDQVVRIEERVLREQVLKKLRSCFSQSEYGELLSDDIVKTALFTFEQHEIIYCNVDKNTKVRSVNLSAKYASLKEVQNVVNIILRYVTR